MDYRSYDKTYYIRLDKGDEIIKSILDVCKKTDIQSAIFSGIGGCSRAEIQTFIASEGRFETNTVEGMLELVSLNGSVTRNDEGEYYHHTHAMFAYKNGQQHAVSGGHIKSVEVLYTAEIELRPVTGGTIKRKTDPETGTGFWSFEE